MRKKTNFFRLPLLFMGIFSVFASSCDKDDDDNAIIEDPKCLISSFIEIAQTPDTTYSGAILYSYNQDGRISKKDYDFTNYYLQFKYYDSGKLERIERHENGVLTRYYLFTWGNNNVIQQRYDIQNDATFEPSGTKKVLKFNNNNEIVRVNFYSSWGDDWELFQHEIFMWENGNIIEREYYHYNVLDYKKKYTYDNKYNPFSLHQSLILEMGITPLAASKNNKISRSKIVNNEETEKDIFNWEYNEQNYPILLKVDPTELPPGYEQKWEFSYKNCE